MVRKERTPTGDDRHRTQLQPPPDDQGLSLEDLSGALANLLGKGSDPYAAAAPAAVSSDPADILLPPAADAAVREHVCPLTPQSILEAMLFVGHPQGEPLSSQQVSALMRGVRRSEVDETVCELNRVYEEEGCPYFVESVGQGYRLVLRESYRAVAQRFQGRVREARLSQAAVDVLSLVAYRQPIAREEVDEVRQEPSGRLLAQLVRRELLSVERTDGRPRRTLYRTTPRFLQLFGLASLDDLPQAQDFDRR